MAYGNPSPLVVEFQTNFFSKYGSMSWYMLKLKPFWALEVQFFDQHIFFIIGHYIRKYYKLRSVWFTLGDALKNFFLFISSFSMSKQPEKPWGAWLFKLFAFSGHPIDLAINTYRFFPRKKMFILSSHHRTYKKNGL